MQHALRLLRARFRNSRFAARLYFFHVICFQMMQRNGVDSDDEDGDVPTADGERVVSDEDDEADFLSSEAEAYR